MKSKQLVGFEEGERKLKRTIQITGMTQKGLMKICNLKKMTTYLSKNKSLNTLIICSK